MKHRPSANTLHHIDHYFHFLMVPCVFLGITNPDSPGSPYFKLTPNWRWPLLILHRTFSVTITLHVGILFLVAFVQTLPGGLSADLFYTLSQCIVMATSAYGLVYFQVKTRKFYRLIDYMNQNFRFRSARGLTFVTTEWTYKMSSRLTYVYTLFGTLTTQFWTIFSLIQSDRVLPLKCWYPFDYTISPYYEVLFVVQVFVQLVVPFGYILFTAFALTAAFLLGSQYDIMFCSLKNVMATTWRKVDSPGTVLKLKNMQNRLEPLAGSLQFPYSDQEYLDCLDEIPGGSTPPFKSVMDELHKSICDCVRHHQIINESCDQLQHLLSTCVLIKSLIISVQICMFAVSMVSVSESTISKMSTGMYLVISCFDVFLISLFGQVIYNQSIRAGDFLVDTPWIEWDTKIRRTMLFMMMYTTKPKCMTGHFFIVRYEHFVATMKLSFSYYTLISSFSE